MNGLSKVKAGGVVLSHTISRAVPSALRGLTTVFGMGTGVTLAAKPPTKKKKGLDRLSLSCSQLLSLAELRSYEEELVFNGLTKPLGPLVLLG